MGQIVNTGSFPKKLWPGVKIWTGMELRDIPAEYETIFKIEKSERRFEEIVSIVPIALPQVKNEGNAIKYNGFEQGLTTRLDNVVYANGFIMTHEIGVDDQYDAKLSELGGRFLARAMRANKEIVCANIYNNGFSAGTALADGQQFFSASHQYKGVVFSNLSTAAALSEASAEQMMIDIGNQVDDAGIRIMLSPTEIHVPLALKYNAKRIFTGIVELRPNTANRDINAMMAWGEDLKLVVHKYFTSNTAWFMRTDLPYVSTILFEREAISGGEDNDFDTGNRKFKIMDRFVPGVGDPRGVQGNAGA